MAPGRLDGALDANEGVTGGVGFLRLASGCALALLAACTTYKAAPLALSPPLASSLAALDRTVPGGTIDISVPLSPQDAARLAVLNDPALAATRAAHGIAAAQLFSAGLLPDPTVSFAQQALFSGPADAPSMGGAIAEDLSALVTYRARTGAARARLGQADADILWQEWQVAAKAETLAIALAADRVTVAALEAERQALGQVAAAAQHAVGTGNLAADQASAALANLAASDAAYDTAEEQRDTDQAALDALLGLTPNVDVALAPPDFAPIGAKAVSALVRTLADRRPDLIALRFGYRAADADLRAAILAQFPGISLGVSGGSDTSHVVSVGPAFALSLPIFNRNRGAVHIATATRAQLRAQFAASLAQAQGQAEAALVALNTLATERGVAEAALASANRDAATAAPAFAAGAIDVRTYADLLSAAESHRVELIAIDRKIETGRVALASLLGFGLPNVQATTFQGKS
jgi:outer membrane protein TolC